jgi:predicted Zn-dependent protease
MLDEIIRTLQANARVDDWQLRRKHMVEHQLYLIGTQVESQRRAETDSINIDVFATSPADQAQGRGASTLQFTPGVSDDIANRIERALDNATLAITPRYELPGPAEYQKIELRDPELAERPWETMERWRTELYDAVRRENDVRLSAAEFFVGLETNSILNSRGVKGDYTATRAFIEIVLLAGNRQEENENYFSTTVRATSHLNLASIIKERATYARDMLKAQTPQSRTCPVIISGRAVASLFDPFVFRVDGQAIYRKFFQTAIGDHIFGDRPVSGDPLDLALDPTIPYGGASAPFDDEGLPLRRIQLIKQGWVESLMASKRYADYLGIPATGAATNTVVGTGSLTFEQLLRGPACHIVEFADFHADPMSGDFVSEIRLGYEIDARGNATPIKGGAVSGNVFSAFANCRMSQETTRLRRYYGPKAVRFEELAIGGA